MALAAELALQAGRRRLAVQLLEEGWRTEPHPEIARIYAQVDPSETASQRLKRIDSRLAPLNRGHVETLVLQAEVGRLTAERLLLAGEAQQAMLDLRVVAGLELSEPLRLRPDGNRTPITLLLESALERGLALRPDLAAARQEEMRVGGEVRLAQAERVPDIAALVRLDGEVRGRGVDGQQRRGRRRCIRGARHRTRADDRQRERSDTKQTVMKHGVLREARA